MGLGTTIANKLLRKAEKKVKEHHSNSKSNYQGNVNHGQVKDRNAELPPLKVQIYTHNIRKENNNMMKGEEPWSKRKVGVIGLIDKHSQSIPTLVGLQEVKQNQLNDILQGLGKPWAFFGVGRDDGKSKGEFAPILYKTDEWDLVSGKTYWLGENPNQPTKGWDAAFPRIVTVVVMKHKKSGKVVNYLNTHYDHKGKKARENSSLQIIDLMSKTEGTSLLSGDFNSQEHEEAYQTLSKSLLDTSCNCHERCGFKDTCTGFEKGGSESSIDFIWTTKGVPIVKHEIIDHECNGSYCSDHRPVTAIFEV